MSVAMLQAEPDVAARPDDTHGIRAGMAVRCVDGAIGRVVGLAPAWLERPTHLVVETGPLTPNPIAIPLQWVGQVTSDQVLLQVRRRQLARLRPCVTDELLRAEVCEAVYNIPTFRADDAFLMIDVAVSDHVVTLRGHVRTLWRALLAETVARQVPGVWEIHNQLIGDDELAEAVMQAVRREPRLHAPTIRAHATLGQVTLSGKVRAAEEATLALLLARRVPGVRTLTSELVVVESAQRGATRTQDGHALFATRRTAGAGAS